MKRKNNKIPREVRFDKDRVVHNGAESYYQYDDGEKARGVLMSTKDMMFKDRQTVMLSWTGVPVQTWNIPNDEVICNGCNTNIYPENCYGIEYANEETKGEWVLYDIYCLECTDRYWNGLPKNQFMSQRYCSRRE